MADAKPAVTAADLISRLAQRYPSPEWLFETEVTLAGRRLDAVALCLWGGNGRAWRVLGFEVKVRRSDWLKEISQPTKAQFWNGVVDQFFVVAPPDIVQLDELPEGWGLLLAAGSQLRVKKHAAEVKPQETLPRELVARLLTRAEKRADQAEREAAGRIAGATYREIDDQVKKRCAEEIAAARRAEAELAEIRRAAGVHRWEDIPAVLRRAKAVEASLGRLPSIPAKLAEVAEEIATAADRLLVVTASLETPESTETQPSEPSAAA